MNNPNKHIEDLFRERFENYEHPVNEGVWSSIEQQLPQPATPGFSDGGTGQGVISGAASAGMKGMTLVWTGISAVVLVTAGILYFNTADQTPQDEPVNKPETSVSLPVEQDNDEQELSPPVARPNSETVNNTTYGTATMDPQNNNPQSPSHKEEAGSEKTPFTQHPTETTAGDRGSATVSPKSQPATTSPAKPATAEPKTLTTSNLMPVRQNVARIKASVLTGTAPLSVEFINAGNGQVLWWNFGEQLPRNSETAPTHIFSEAGAHKVVLAAVNESGKVFFDTLALNVNPLSAIVFSPNVITPNGDGINDDFELKMRHMAYAQVDIYDAGGKKVFGWEGAEGRWTGKNFGGELMPGGSYYYTVVAIGKDGEKHTSNGMIRLIR